jgi:hypothetical protein
MLTALQNKCTHYLEINETSFKIQDLGNINQNE